jgi:hypothetical protein
MVEEPARRRDDDVGAAPEGGGLLTEADAAVDGRDLDVRVFGEGGEVCGASSRVGARISACVLPRGRSISACTSGSPNAADLPLPVAALASRSRPARAGGIAALCTGVGSVNPRSVTARKSCGRSPRLSKGEMIVRLSEVVRN